MGYFNVMKKHLKFLIVLLLGTMLLVACSEDSEDTDGNDESENTTDSNDTETENDAADEGSETDVPNVEVSEEEKVAADEVVLVVNGEEVLGEAYNTSYIDTKSYLAQNGQDTSDLDMLKEQALTSLKSQTLLAQDAEAKGIEVTETDIDEAIEQTKSQFETQEEFEAALEQLSYTEEKFRSVLRTQLLQQYYIEEEIGEIEVTDAEVEEYYELLQQQMGEEAPALEEVRPQVESQITQSKTQEAFLAEIEQLREEADIEERI